MNRLWKILERLGLFTFKNSMTIHTAKGFSSTSAAVLLRELESKFPAYSEEYQLMSITSSRLADCLTGGADAARLLFDSAESQRLLNQYYTLSPQLACSTDNLSDLMNRIMSNNDRGMVNIFEVGGGFGDTNTRLAEMLGGMDRPDISPKLVKAAKARFSAHSWMHFSTLDLEEDPLPSLQGKYDIVIGTNVVHATSNIIRSCVRIKSLLRDGRVMILSEVTHKVDWYDLVFGLLEGRWCFKDGRDYPLQPPTTGSNA